MHPSIDHTLLSPSGHCSKRARDAAMKREKAKLFPPGFWDTPEPSQEEKDRNKATQLRRQAQTLNELAERGMCQRKYTKMAAKLTAEANNLCPQTKGEK